MLIAAFILVISLAALLRFAVFSWRAGLLRGAARPVGSEAEARAEQALNSLYSQDFRDIYAYQKLCPDLRGGASGLRSVRVYYKIVQSLSALAGAILPKGLATGWAQGEMELCARYAQVVLRQRVARNQTVFAETGTY